MNNQESKNCQNCKKEFTIEPEDFAFYERINVPPPTFCPECRFQRRLSWRNERTLHRNKCAATGKEIISGFAPDAGYILYDRDYWWSDAWDPAAAGQEYDFSKSFFAQFNELMHRVPHPAVFNARTINCNYTQYTGDFKDGYLVSASWDGENVAYSARVQAIKDSLDCYILMDGSSLCYEIVSSSKMYGSSFCEKSENCADSMFLYECKGCTNCFGCTNLRNKSYHIFNEPYSREEYKKKIQEMNLGSYENLTKAKQKFEEIKSQAIRKYANFINAPECTGDDLVNTFNCKSCFVANDMRDCKYVMNSLQGKDSYDGYGIGGAAELMYEAFDSGVQGSRLCFVATVYGGMNIFYSYNCHGSQNLFGCVGLRGKQYCIFNKQYSRQEYEELVGKIKTQMTNDKEYGEFFPIGISPFGYNETVAHDYFELSELEARGRGYKWRMPEKSSAQITKKTSELPDSINNTDDLILKEIIECSGCKKPYRFIKKEFDFLKRFNIALPRKCFECRHMDRFHKVNFPRLYNRQCAKCGVDIKTSFAPDRPEIVYCEKCYLSEVA